MKLYVFAAPYDYHEKGELVVMAETLTEARAIARDMVTLSLNEGFNGNTYFWESVDGSGGKEVPAQWYANYGCDC